MNAAEYPNSNEPISAQFTSSDNLKLYYEYHRVIHSKASLIVLHGKGEHCGRYDEWIDRVTREGISVAIFDYRGHGKSEGREVYAESFEVLLEDVSTFLAHLQEEHDFPYQFILYGNSLGGLLSTHWAQRNQERLIGLVLSAPCFGVNIPWILKFLNDVIHATHHTFEYRNPVYPPYLTHDVDEIRKYQEDPLIKRKITSRLLKEMLVWGRELEEADNLSFLVPVYIFRAGLEKIVSLSAIDNVYSSMKAPKKEMYNMSDFYHEIFHEEDRDSAFKLLSNTLQELTA